MDIEKEALKKLYVQEWKEFKKEREKHLNNDIENELCKIALDVLGSLRKEVKENEDEKKDLIDKRNLHYSKKKNELKFAEAVKYKAWKEYLCKIEDQLKVKGLIPEIDSQGGILFKELKN